MKRDLILAINQLKEMTINQLELSKINIDEREIDNLARQIAGCLDEFGFDYNDGTMSRYRESIFYIKYISSYFKYGDYITIISGGCEYVFKDPCNELYEILNSVEAIGKLKISSTYIEDSTIPNDLDVEYCGQVTQVRIK